MVHTERQTDLTAAASHRGGGRTHRRRAIAAAVLGATLLGGAAAGGTPARADTGPIEHVVVRAVAGRMASVEGQARAAGATIERDLPIIDGFSAAMPASARDELVTSPDVVSVSDDASVHPLGSSYSPTLGYDPVNDTGSLYAIARMSGATSMWKAGYTGKGVDVAVIDTGVAPVTGLNAPGKVVNGADLSFDSQNAKTAYNDGFGHGTMMAGIIAGNDAAGCMSSCATVYQDPSRFEGIAPDSRIVNVKVGAYDGGSDVSQVIAAIDWVVQHRNDNGLNIRVINLSYGTQSLQGYDVDPLAYAAEVAWRNGIVVVAAAGNDGAAGVQSLADPAYDPHVLAVGADDPMGTYTFSDDVVPDFASHGTMQRPVDVIAPGTHVIGLRVPGSFVDTFLSPGPVGTRFQRGSGTSESTAVVSGLVALMLQQQQASTPDTVRQRLWAGATQLDLSNANLNLGTTHYNKAQALYYEGAGVSTVQPSDATKTPPSYLVNAVSAKPWSTGAGSLELARGGAHVISNGVPLTGEMDVFGHAFSAVGMAAAEALGSSWTGGTWNGSTWTGSTWSGSTWTGSTWTGSTWSGSTWSGSTWSGSTWSGSTWSGSTWSGSTWSGSTWSGSTWSGSTWS